MARIRTIKPAFFRHLDLFEAERETGLPLRIAFAGLWTVADREGRFRWEPRAIKLDCLPYDDVDFSRVLDALTTRGFVVRYNVETREYGYIPSFPKHQVINNREAASDLPEPNETNILTREARVDDACLQSLKSAQGEGKGREQEGKGRERTKRRVDDASAARFDDFKKGYPKRKGANPWKPARDRFSALVKAGEDPEVIILGARRYSAELAEDGKVGTGFVAQAVTWLNQHRWKDYARPAAVTQVSGPPAPGLPTDEELRRKYGASNGRRVGIEAPPATSGAAEQGDEGNLPPHGNGVHSSELRNGRGPDDQTRQPGMRGVGEILRRSSGLAAVGISGADGWQPPGDDGADPVA
jgi:hypothetical protein